MPVLVTSDVVEPYLSSHKPLELKSSHGLVESSGSRVTKTVESFGLQVRVNVESDKIKHFP